MRGNFCKTQDVFIEIFSRGGTSPPDAFLRLEDRHIRVQKLMANGSAPVHSSWTWARHGI